MLEEATLDCPYCGEAVSVLVDCSAGHQRYVEDCSVCCQPIELVITITPEGGVADIQARPEND